VFGEAANSCPIWKNVKRTLEKYVRDVALKLYELGYNIFLIVFKPLLALHRDEE
jgi:hypothetical protein